MTGLNTGRILCTQFTGLLARPWAFVKAKVVLLLSTDLSSFEAPLKGMAEEQVFLTK
jgi:hypothetical protein